MGRMTRAASSANRDIIKWNENASENYVPKSLCESEQGREWGAKMFRWQMNAMQLIMKAMRAKSQNLLCSGALKPTHALPAADQMEWNRI